MASRDEYAKTLQEEIERLRIEKEERDKTIAALRSEFSAANSSDEITLIARKAIVELMPKAIIQMGTLIEFAESESVRASLSRFVVACGLDKAKFEDTSSGELKKLLTELAANDG